MESDEVAQTQSMLSSPPALESTDMTKRPSSRPRTRTLHASLKPHLTLPFLPSHTRARKPGSKERACAPASPVTNVSPLSHDPRDRRFPTRSYDARIEISISFSYPCLKTPVENSKLS